MPDPISIPVPLRALLRSAGVDPADVEAWECDVDTRTWRVRLRARVDEVHMSVAAP